DKKEKEIKEKEIEEKRGTFKLGDLYKMHTYREAILRKEDKKKPLWVIALYPGTKVALYSESLTSIELDVKDVKNDKIIEKDFFSSGGVGALPFTPSLLDDEKYKSWLNNLFDLLLEVENV
ncbi:MAG: nuclease domain-containing protein, partial [candidate division WOR-3 bacterium]